RLNGRLVRIVDPGEVFDLTAARFLIHPLHISSLTFCERRVHEHFDKSLSSNSVSHIVARRAIRTHRGTNHRPLMLHDLRRHEPDPPDVRITIFLTEPQST